MMFDLLAATTAMLADVTPWFSNPGAAGGIAGAAVGVLGGGIYGPLVGICAPQGKAKGFVMGYHFALLGLGVVLLLTAIYALIVGQPYGIWFGLLMPGVLLVVLMSAFTPMVRMRYRQAEQRKLSAQEFRQG
jgi:peptidoglycan/LPS O-acetylase OafA/YrhL